VFVIIGFIVVIGSVLGGYLLHGGNIHVLNQPTEFLIIGGAGIGSLVVSSPPSLIKAIMKQVTHAITAKGVTKDEYMELLLLLYELTKTAKGNLLALEAHIEKPENSEIFKKYPSVLKNHHAIHFLCDTLKVQVSSSLSPYDLEELMDTDIQSTHKEEEAAPAAVSKLGDAMPGLGIVAAVLGVVITMGKLTQGKEVIGHSVAGALVGTFIGILLSYGIFGPLATKMESNIASEGKIFEVIKACLIAFAKDAAPKVCVEYARRTVPPEFRPSFTEVDAATSGGAKKAA
jgi:chemotaxis protein MotA